MKLDTLKENENLIKSVRQNLGYDEDDDSNDEQIAEMSKERLFKSFLTWNGILMYDQILLSVYSTLKGSLEDGLINHDHLAANDNEGIIECLRKRKGFPDFDDPDFDDEKFDKYINGLDLKQALDDYLAWNGIIGFTGMIINVLKTLEEAE